MLKIINKNLKKMHLIGMNTKKSHGLISDAYTPVISRWLQTLNIYIIVIILYQYTKIEYK